VQQHVWAATVERLTSSRRGSVTTVRQKRRRLSRSAEFDRVYRRGRSAGTRFLVLYSFPRAVSGSEGGGSAAEAGVRLGVSVGRRVGGAVVRNRVKRLVREAFWNLSDSLGDDHDYVVVARADAATLAEREGLAGVERELRELLQKLGIVPSPADGERAEKG
jgi:ribonuclease P protein component